MCRATSAGRPDFAVYSISAVPSSSPRSRPSSSVASSSHAQSTSPTSSSNHAVSPPSSHSSSTSAHSSAHSSVVIPSPSAVGCHPSALSSTRPPSSSLGHSSSFGTHSSGRSVSRLRRRVLPWLALPARGCCSQGQVSCQGGACEGDSFIEHDIRLDVLRSQWKSPICALESASLLMESEESGSGLDSTTRGPVVMDLSGDAGGKNGDCARYIVSGPRLANFIC